MISLCLWAWSLVGLESTPPNLLLILCDDMGFSDLGCYGGEIETKTLDRLAQEGIRFTQCYNNAKCTTTRASLMTGLYPRFRGSHLKENMLTMAEAMKLAGYQTSLSGKWHLGHQKDRHPFHRGFDRFYGLLDGCCNFFDPSRPDPPYKGNRVRRFARNTEPITEFPDDYYTTDAFTDHAIETIRDFDQAGKPWFVHVAYTAPHYPLHARPEDIKRYRGKYLDGWDELRRKRWKKQKELGLTDDSWTLTEGDSRAYSWDSADAEFEDLRMAVYAAMIDSMDQNIARLVEAIEKTQEPDNTIILFLSDNGGCAEEPGGRDPNVRRPGPVDDYVAVGPSWGWAQNAPFRRYKSWVHEGGITTPLIVWWPGRIPAGTINRDPVHIIDFLPTFLDLAGESFPTHRGEVEVLPLEGTSMRPILFGESREPPAQLAWFWAGNRAIRHGDWKLVWDKKIKEWELYDLSVDRCETRNRAGQHPDRVDEMSRAWKAWASKMGVKGF